MASTPVTVLGKRRAAAERNPRFRFNTAHDIRRGCNSIGPVGDEGVAQNTMARMALAEDTGTTIGNRQKQPQEP